MARLPALRHIREDDRVALFIDGANLYQAARALDFDIDYKRLLEIFAADARLIRAYYYTALLDDQEYSPIRPLVDWLDYNGFTMITKPLKEFTHATGRRKFKGNMDVEIAVHAMEIAPACRSHLPDVRRWRFPSAGRGIAASSRRPCQRRQHHPPTIADDDRHDELRRQADFFVDLANLQHEIAREHVGPRDDSRRAATYHMPDDEDELDDEDAEAFDD